MIIAERVTCLHWHRTVVPFVFCVVLVRRIAQAPALGGIVLVCISNISNMEAVRCCRHVLHVRNAWHVAIRRARAIGVGVAVQRWLTHTWLECTLRCVCACDVAIGRLQWLWPMPLLLPRMACRSAYQSHPLYHCLDVPAQLPQPRNATSTRRVRALGHFRGQRAMAGWSHPRDITALSPRAHDHPQSLTPRLAILSPRHLRRGDALPAAPCILAHNTYVHRQRGHLTCELRASRRLYSRVCVTTHAPVHVAQVARDYLLVRAPFSVAGMRARRGRRAAQVRVRTLELLHER